MAKTSKRSKKFSAKGGPKAMIVKKGGNITKKGKQKKVGGGGALNKKQQQQAKQELSRQKEERAKQINEERENRRKEEDFVEGINVKNLGDLDIDSFFEMAVGDINGDDSVDGEDDSDEEREKERRKSVDDGEGSNKNDDISNSDSDGEDSLESADDDLEGAEARMKMELEKLKRTDPEFHKYLKENESSLLEFGDDASDEVSEDHIDEEHADEEDADEEDDDKEAAEPKKTQSKKEKREQTSEEVADEASPDSKSVLTPKRLRSLEQGAFQSHSIKGLKRILSAFKTACHLSDASQQDSNEQEMASSKRRHGKELRIDSPLVFDRLMAVCLTSCHEEFYFHLLGEGSGLKEEVTETPKDEEKDDGGEKGDDRDEVASSDGDKHKAAEHSKKYSLPDENKPLHPKLFTKSPHWKELSPFIESFFKSSSHILLEAKESNLLKFVLQALSKYVPYMTAFPRIAKALLKTCNKIWSAPLDSSEEYQVVRLNAFLRIRQLAITQPYPFIEDCLKMTYLSYAKRSKFGTASNISTVLPTLTFMGNCVVELYSLDYASSYQHAFVYIRQLALHLRTALQKKTPEAVQTVYCWQYMHCLKLWVAVLTASCGKLSSKPAGGGKDEEADLLRSLVFPLTEIISGVVRLVPVVRYLPLRLHCIRLLQQLAAASEAFIPTTSLLLGVFDLKELTMKPLRGKQGRNASSSSVRGLRLPLILKLPKEGTLRTVEQLDVCLKEVFLLLNREIDLYRYSPGCPEFNYLIKQKLRKFNKDVNSGRWRAYSKGCIELCDKYSTFATQARSTLAEAPKDVKRLEALKPSSVPSMGERYELAISKEKRLEALSQPKISSSATKNKEEKKGSRKAVEEEVEELMSDDEGERRKGADVKSANKTKQSKRKKTVNEPDMKNVEVMEEEDEVQDGIDWSDSE